MHFLPVTLAAMSESPTRYSRLLAAIGYSRELNLVDSSEEQSELLEWIATACTGTLEEMQGEILLEQEELTLSVYCSARRFALMERILQLRNRAQTWGRHSNTAQSQRPRTRSVRSGHSRLPHAIADTVSRLLNSEETKLSFRLFSSTLERNQSTTQRLQDALNSNTRRLSIIKYVEYRLPSTQT